MTRLLPLWTLALLAQAGCPPAVAGQPEADPARAAVVHSLQDPGTRLGALIRAGDEAFDAHRGLAPDAPAARFKLRLHGAADGSGLHAVNLDVVGAEVEISRPAAAGGDLRQPVDEAAAYRYAGQLLARKDPGYSLRAEVRSAGVPADRRRLGDLRLECQVNVAIAKQGLGFLARTAVSAFLSTSDWCTHDENVAAAVSTGKLTAATLVVGADRIPLKVDARGATYLPPVNDPRYPDDATIELQFAQTPGDDGASTTTSR